MSDASARGLPVDEPQRHRFTLEEDGSVAELVYRRGGGRLVLVHTEVPRAIGGRGVGGRLVRAAVERAADEGLTLVPWCPFARRWLKEHPEAVGQLAVDWQSSRA